MSAPKWWPDLFRVREEDASKTTRRTVTCVKCGKPTWRRLDQYVGVHRQCEGAEVVARL